MPDKLQQDVGLPSISGLQNRSSPAKIGIFGFIKRHGAKSCTNWLSDLLLRPLLNMVLAFHPAQLFWGPWQGAVFSCQLPGGKNYRTSVYMCCISQCPGARIHPWLCRSSSPPLDHKRVEPMIKHGQEKPGQLSPPGSCKDFRDRPKACGSWLLGQPITQGLWRVLRCDPKRFCLN